MCMGCLLRLLEVKEKLDCGRLDCLLQPVAAPVETAAATGWVMDGKALSTQALVCKGSQEVAAAWDPSIALQAKL